MSIRMDAVCAEMSVEVCFSLRQKAGVVPRQLSKRGASFVCRSATRCRRMGEERTAAMKGGVMKLRRRSQPMLPLKGGAWKKGDRNTGVEEEEEEEKSIAAKASGLLGED